MTGTILAIVIAIIGLLLNLATIFGFIVKIVRWIDRQKEQDRELESIRHEQSIITVGVLACLKSIVGEKDEAEVRTAINLIEDHLNKKAHEN